MQIHRLNNFTDPLTKDAFVVVDNGFDTGKLSVPALLNPAIEVAEAVDKRIDNIITSPAPSAEEIVDARIAANRIVYPSLGKAIRGQVEGLQSEVDKCFTITANINDEAYEYGGIWQGGNYDNAKLARSLFYIPAEASTVLKAYAYYDVQSPPTIGSLLITEYDQEKNYLRQGLLYTAPKWNGFDITLGANTAYIKINTTDEIVDLDLTQMKIAIYKSADYSASYIPHKVPAWDGDQLPECGLKIDNGSYIHFTKCGENKYICREFKHIFINNLLQLYKMYYASFVDGDIAIGSAIGESYSDVVGPISIHRGEIDNYNGKWSGGSHGVTINGVEYPTAEEKSLHIYVGGEEVVADGVYLGNVSIIAENTLYFPQTITGGDLSTATKAFTEKRCYRLTDKMNVKTFLTSEYESAIGVFSYYGCQCNTYNMTRVLLPNNEIEMSTSPAQTYYFENKENKYYCSRSNEHYDVTLKEVGLGLYPRSNGSSELKWGNVATFQKIYFQLIFNSYIATGRTIMWEADYDYYVD